MKTLPKRIKKLSQLVRLAIKDLEVVEKLPGYHINMNIWHWYSCEKCFVCLAGAVMVNSLEAKFTDELMPCDFGEDSRKLRALDLFRSGYLLEAIYVFTNSNSYISALPLEVSIPHYSHSPVEFKKEMLYWARKLAKEGY